ncbi:MAG: 2-hydroxyacyl-CoA dehydratase subunit D [Spirochaetota bacterium]
MDIIQEFKDVVENPYKYVQDLKNKTGKPVVAYLCSYTPEEVVHAAGAHPFRVFGVSESITRADAHLQSYSCSLVRGVLEDSLTGKLDFIDGAVFPHTCDSIQRLSDIWRMNTDYKFHADIVLPVKLNTDSAREYMYEVMNKFKADIEKGLGVPVTASSLAEAAETYNDIRKNLFRMYQLKSEHPGLISGGDMYAVVKGSMIMERNQVKEKLALLVSELEKSASQSAVTGRKRIILTGGICNHPDIYTIIEESGGDVVWDDLCTGSRYFEGVLNRNDDPLKSIADRYCDRLVCPAKHSSETSRGENIARIAKEHYADGALFLFLKFCDPHSFDYPYLKEYLDSVNVPSILLEVEEQLPSEGQLKTRFEAFIEML